MCSKIEFNSYTEATKELKKINWFLCMKKKKKLTKIYKCKHCGKFHLTSDTHSHNIYRKQYNIEMGDMVI
jgi:hypothetical protein